MNLPDDLKNWHADSDPWQLLDGSLALSAFIALVLAGIIVLHLGAP